MKFTALPFVIFLASPAILKAQSPFPLKGEWLEYDADSDIVSSKLVLQADGRGTMTDLYGVTDITWKLEGGLVKIAVPFPNLHSEDYVDDKTGEYFHAERGIEGLSFKFKKLDGFAVQWEVTTSTVLHFPQNPEKQDLHETGVSPNVRLVAPRQLKSMSIAKGELFSIALVGYKLDNPEDSIDPEILVRADAGNVLTVIDGTPIGVDKLFWSQENGALVVADGKGYSARYKIFKSDKVSQLLWAEADRSGVPSVSSAPSVKVQADVKAKGFDQDSALFKNCWTYLGAEFCFHKSREFVFSYTYDGQIGETHGLWHLEGNQVKVIRYASDEGQITDLEGMLKCEAEGNCRIHQERSYELLNQDADHLSVHRHMVNGSYDYHNFHVFTKSSKVPH